MLRLFVGIEFPPELKLQLSMLETGIPGAKWVDAGNLHLTLRFIGDIDDALAGEIAGVLGRVHRHAFDLHLDGLTSFGGRKPRAVVAMIFWSKAPGRHRAQLAVSGIRWHNSAGTGRPFRHPRCTR